MFKEAVLWKELEEKGALCCLCAHRCIIPPEGYGKCGMRKNIDGILFTFAYGKVIAEHVDPIEKKPLYHFLPGSNTYSIATLGCNLKCSFCQNWSISQVRAIEKDDIDGKEMSPAEIVRKAKETFCYNISYTYTEPTVFFEYAYDIAKIAHENGIKNSFITNGFMTKEALEAISPYLDAANVDLKFFKDSTYKKMCEGSLGPVLETIRRMKEAGIWIEVTTLIIPGENDSDEELRDIARFLAGIDVNIPWHLSRFHPNYKEKKIAFTPSESIKKAMAIGKKEGLLYVYPGNTEFSADTVCPGCGRTLIERQGFHSSVTGHFDERGQCKMCEIRISGVWE
ncbi:MAG: AmmeMemoRadiSam system radical SAM enzyme [Candidatus Omnitrophota bacterium]